MDNDELLIAMKDIFEKNIDKIEKKFDEKIEEVKRHSGVIVEDLKRDVKAIAEGYSLLENKIDNLQEEVCELKKDMSIVKDYVIAVDLKLNEHEVLLKLHCCFLRMYSIKLYIVIRCCFPILKDLISSEFSNCSERSEILLSQYRI